VVLLFRAMSNVPLYEAALRQYGLNYYPRGRTGLFFAQQEIYDLLNLLPHPWKNPQDSLSLAGDPCGRRSAVSVTRPCLSLAGTRGGFVGRPCLDAGLEGALCPFDSAGGGAPGPPKHLQRWRGLKESAAHCPAARGGLLPIPASMRPPSFEYLADRKLANLWKLLDLAPHLSTAPRCLAWPTFIARLGDLVKNQAHEGAGQHSARRMPMSFG